MAGNRDLEHWFGSDNSCNAVKISSLMFYTILYNKNLMDYKGRTFVRLKFFEYI